METVYKYEIPEGGGKFELQLPGGAEVLTVQAQGNVPNMWVKVNTANQAEKRVFEACGTGMALKKLEPGPSRKYIASYQLDAGVYVFHVFEILNYHV